MSKKLMITFSRIIVTQLHYYHWGSFFITKYGILVQIWILLKIYNLPLIITLLCLLAGIISIQLFGWFLDKTGIVEAFNERTNKGLIKGIRK